MKIEQLTLENFKCFKSEKTFDFSRLTILTGANSSGKSSVIYAILASLQSDDFPYKFSLNGTYVNLGDFREISNIHKKDNTISVGLKITNYLHSNSSVYLKTKWIEDKTDMLPVLDKLDSGIQSETENRMFFSRYSANKNEFEIDIINNNLIELRKKSNYISAFRQAPRRTYLEQNKGSYKVGTEGEEYIDQIVEWDKRSNGKSKQLIEAMKNLDLIEELKINRLGGGRFEVLVKPINSNGLSALNDVGSGISAFMPIIVADLQLSDDSTLFVAEPEIHLHPSIQSKFGDYIIDKINTTDKNYVIETHSEYFLNKIRLAIVKGELKKEDVKVYFLENTGEDTEVYDIDFRKNGGIRNAPQSFFETHSMDVMEIALNAFDE
jgi:predicted ATPase